MPRKLRAIDLFCGAGGLSCGLEQAGINVLAGFEADPVAHRTFLVNHARQTAVREPTDVVELTAELVWRRLGCDAGDIDVVAGGPPCQGFSTAGNREIQDDRNLLVLHFARLVGELQPRFFVMENVVGLLSMRNRRGQRMLDTIDEAFAAHGYRTNIPRDHDDAPSLIVNAADHGVPQRRRRVLILGSREGAPPVLPRPTHQDRTSVPRDPTRRPHVSVDDAIGDLPEPSHQEPLTVPSRRAGSEFARAMRDQDGRLWNHTPTKHKPFMVDRMQRQEPGTPLYDTWAHAWVRLVADEPSPTVKENHNAPFVHHARPRVLTPRECARLQSFPDGFRFEGPKSRQLVQIGNAVPPLLGKAIGEAFVEAAANRGREGTGAAGDARENPWMTHLSSGG